MKLALFHNNTNFPIAQEMGAVISRHSCTVQYFETGNVWETESGNNPATLPEDTTHILFLYANTVGDFSAFLFLSGYCLGRKIPVFILETDSKNLVPKKCRNLGKIVKPVNFEDFFINQRMYFLDEDKKNNARDELLKRGISCFEENFMLIVSSGDAEAVSLFLEAGFDPSLVDAKGIPLLSLAVRAQFPRVAAQLIEAGADVDRLSGDRGYSPLMDAAQKGDIAMVKLLLEKGSRCDLRSKDGQTALIICAGRGDVEMAGLLVSRGADPEAKDNLGMSAAGYAKLFKNQKMMELFNISLA